MTWRAPFMLTEAEYSLLLAATVGRIVDYTEMRNFRAADILRAALRKVENELVAASDRVTFEEGADGQLCMRWPHETGPLW